MIYIQRKSARQITRQHGGQIERIGKEFIMHTRITKNEFYAAGGLANPNLFRKQKGSGWVYYRKSP